LDSKVVGKPSCGGGEHYCAQPAQSAGHVFFALRFLGLGFFLAGRGCGGVASIFAMAASRRFTISFSLSWSLKGAP